MGRNIFRSLNKYGNRKTAGGMASKMEADLYDLLLLKEKSKEIHNIEKQCNVHLTRAKILYIADFSYEDRKTGEKIWAEMKGFETAVWRIKRRLWKCYGPGKLQVYKGRGGRVYLHEEIVSEKFE